MFKPEQLEFIIPSLNRPKQLSRAIKSIPKQFKVTPVVEDTPRSIATVVNEAMQKSTGDIVCFFADHMVMEPRCGEEILSLFEEHFPTLEGGVGLNLWNTRTKQGVSEYRFIALGRPIIEHFPNCQIFCPDYYHFYVDTELGQYLTYEKKFIFGKNAKAASYHPTIGNAPVDSTHKDGRIYRNEDKAINEERKERGWLWGKDFNLLKPWPWQNEESYNDY